jgi:hypothetical protein
MGRPERHDVDYFPFFAKRGKTLNVLQSKFGLEGIGFFTNLMRFLALTPDHYYCIADEIDRLNFFAETGIKDEEKGIAIIELMVKTGKLDKDLWEKHKVIACEAFLKSLEEAYKFRKNEIITIEQIRALFENSANSGVSQQGNPVKLQGNPPVCGFPSEISEDNPQSKVNKSKVNNCGSDEPPDEKPFSGQKPDNPKKSPLRERDPENDMEKVEKAYLQDWDVLFSRGKVATPEPAVSWSKTRKLLKQHFVKIKPEQIITALEKGMNDDLVMRNAYSLSFMLTDTHLNRLINQQPRSPPIYSEKPERNSYIPSAEETNKMLDKMLKNRDASVTNVDLSTALRNIARKNINLETEALKAQAAAEDIEF